jgi:hypothetical protein
MQYTSRIEFPNGAGFTPCTERYYNLHVEFKTLNDRAHEDENGLTYDECNRLRELEDQLGSMQLDGHLGMSVRYQP